ncbi:MAG: hypothetical protein M3Q30_02120 [Actinomycetota bacterium]|nr:hypothetical protein [Actinomycetota bacterium]
MNVLVCGRFAGVPHQGGTTWALLQYVLGLRRLGHDVLVVEPLSTTPDARVADCFRRVVEEFSLHDRAALLVDDGVGGMGSTHAEVLAFARRADVLLNASGVLKDERIFGAIPTRVYLDLDPAFTQLWHAFERVDMGLDGHTHFVTVGLGIGRESSVPTCGRDWITSLPPVVLDQWAVARHPAHNALTTVANWRAYGSVHHDGVLYGQKAHSLRALIDLPDRTDETLLLALDIHPNERSDVQALADHGWRRTDPRAAAGTPRRYRAFVRGSKAELGIAKSGYVVSRSAWFSDRSACYLASGRPVVAQDTGFSGHLPTGRGLFAFHDADGAIAAIDAINRDYEGNARAARAIAEDHFDSDRVLTALLAQV